jgi:hypothetical protein
VDPRGVSEEGGPMVCIWGNLLCQLGGVRAWGDLRCLGARGLLRYNAGGLAERCNSRDEGFPYKCNGWARGLLRYNAGGLAERCNSRDEG